MENIEERIIDTISEICWVEKEAIALDVSLFDDIGVTSTTFVELMAKIEMEFDITFDDKVYDMTRYKTVEDIVNVVKSNGG